MFQWIESIALNDGVLKNIMWHQQRLDFTLSAHASSYTLNLVELLKKYSLPKKGYYKVRVVYDKRQVVEVNWDLYVPQKLQCFDLVEASTLKYMYKSINRVIFDKLKQKIQGDEIIITQQQYLTDTSFSNLVFKQGDNWFTPTTYLLNGTQRQLLLAEKIIQERKITINSLNLYSHFKLINAMLPFDRSPVYCIQQIKN